MEHEQEQHVAESGASPFATVKEACDYLRFSRTTVEDLLRDGTIPAGKPNGRWRIPWKNLEQYAASKPG